MNMNKIEDKLLSLLHGIALCFFVITGIIIWYLSKLGEYFHGTSD